MNWIFRLLLVAELCVFTGSARAEPAADAAAQTFDVLEYRVEGNTLLSTTMVEQIVYPFLGSAKSISDIETARLALEQRYRDAGYPSVLVDIPEQEVKSGVVRLRVTEGRIETLRITGSRYFTLERMRADAAGIAEGNVLYVPGVQSQLNVLNSLTADRSVAPVLRPGRTPGTVEIELKVADELPLHGSVELSDRDGAGTTRTRLNAQVRYDNLWQRAHSLSLQYQTTPEKPEEVRVWSGTYLARFTGAQTLLAVYGVKSDSSSAAVGDIDVLGRGNILGARVIQPIMTDVAVSHSAVLGVDYKDFAEDLEVKGQDNPLSTPIDYYLFSAQYNATVRAEKSSTRLGMGLNFGIRGIGDELIDCERLALDENGNQVIATQRYNEFGCKRPGARPNYVYLRGSADYTRELPLAMSLRFVLEGQLANSPLISNEQYGAGGVDSVRGYFESQILGDDGLRGALELWSPSFGAKLSGQVQELRAGVFIEGAAVHMQDAAAGQDSSEQLASAGIAARLSAWKHLNAALYWAQVFEDAGDIEAGDSRVHFRVEYAF